MASVGWTERIERAARSTVERTAERGEERPRPTPAMKSPGSRHGWLGWWLIRMRRSGLLEQLEPRGVLEAGEGGHLNVGGEPQRSVRRHGCLDEWRSSMSSHGLLERLGSRGDLDSGECSLRTVGGEAMRSAGARRTFIRAKMQSWSDRVRCGEGGGESTRPPTTPCSGRRARGIL
jgi:hypothetical protein